NPASDRQKEKTLMPWYAASAIVAFRLRSGIQDRFTLHENVILVQGQDEREALAKAERFARETAVVDDETLTVDGQPAFAEFCGIRKLISVSNIYSEDDAPGDGAEVTYSVLEVEDSSAISNLVEGAVVTLKYVE